MPDILYYETTNPSNLTATINGQVVAKSVEPRSGDTTFRVLDVHSDKDCCFTLSRDIMASMSSEHALRYAVDMLANGILDLRHMVPRQEQTSDVLRNLIGRYGYRMPGRGRMPVERWVPNSYMADSPYRELLPGVAGVERKAKNAHKPVRVIRFHVD